MVNIKLFNIDRASVRPIRMFKETVLTDELILQDYDGRLTERILTDLKWDLCKDLMRFLEEQQAIEKYREKDWRNGGTRYALEIRPGIINVPNFGKLITFEGQGKIKEEDLVSEMLHVFRS